MKKFIKKILKIIGISFIALMFLALLIPNDNKKDDTVKKSDTNIENKKKTENQKKEVTNDLTPLTNLYGQWLNDEGNYNMALNESYYFEYMGDLNTATTDSGYNIYCYKVISQKQNDSKYIDYFGKGYYIVLELSDNEGLVSQQLIYTESLGSNEIYSLDRIAYNGKFSGKFTDQQKLVRYNSQNNSKAYIFTDEDDTNAKKGTYSSREIIKKAFIGEYKPMPDYKNNQNINLETFAYTPERYTTNGEIGYSGKEIVCEVVSSQYNDPKYIKLNGDGYYFMIKLRKEWSTTEFDRAILFYKQNLNDDIVICYRDDNYNEKKGNFKKENQYYMSRKY